MPQLAGFAMGFVGVGGTMAATAGGALFGGWAFGAAAASTAFGSLASSLLASVALSALSHALQPKQTVPPVGVKQNVTMGGVTPESFILGKFATAGHMVAPPYVHGKSGSTPNAYLTLITELGGIPGQTLDGIIVDGQEVTITSTVHPDYGNELGGHYAGKAWVKFHDGTQTAADPYLLSKYSADPDRPWSSSMIGTGLCYAICTFLFDRNIYTGIPRVTFVCGGVPLYDPRQDTSVGGSGSQRWSDSTTWAQTDNPAVMAYNIARGITLPDGNVWGGEYDAAGLPFNNWVAAMNACDVTVTNADSSTEPAYRAGYEVTVDQKPKDVVDELMKSCAGQVAPMGGTLKVRVGGPGLPVYFFTDDDLIVSDSQDFAPFPGLSATHNAVTAQYPEPTSLWQTHDAPPRYNATWEAQDQNRRLVAALQFPSVPYGNQVQRLMKSYITDARRFRQHTITLPPDAAALEPLDVVSWTSAANGYSSKSFDVAQSIDAQATVLQKLSIREVDPTDYSWDASTMQLPDAPTAASITPLATQAVPGFAVAATTIDDASGAARRAAIQITWTGTDLVDARGVTWQVRVKATGVIVASGTTLDATSGQAIVSSGILPATLYQVQAQIVVNRPTAWTAWTDVLTSDTRLGYLDIATQIASDIANAAKVPAVTSLPADNTTYGNVVFLTTDKKIYRWDSTASAWVATVPTTDLSGQITASQLAANSVTAGVIQAGAIGASAIAAGAVDATKINVQDLSAISANLGAITVDNAHIVNAAIDTLKVAGNAITNIGVWGASASNIGGTTQVLSASLSLAQAGTIIVLTQVDFTPGGSQVNGWGTGTFWTYVNGVQVNALGGLYDPNGRQVNVMRLGAGGANAGSNSITVNCNATVASNFGITVLAIGIMR